MKNIITKAKKVIVGAGLIALATSANVAEAKESANKEDKLVEKMQWELQEEENKKLCSRLPNSKYVLQTREELLKQGVQPHAVDNVHGRCYAIIKDPVWTEQLESEIEYATRQPAGIMTLNKRKNGNLDVQVFVGKKYESEMIITFTNAKSCLNSCPANSSAHIGPDAESSCECEPEQPVSSLKKANNKKAAMVQSMLYVNGR